MQELSVDGELENLGPGSREPEEHTTAKVSLDLRSLG